LTQEPQLGAKTVDEFVARWKNRQRIRATMLPKQFEELRAQGLPVRAVWFWQETANNVITKKLLRN